MPAGKLFLASVEIGANAVGGIDGVGAGGEIDDDERGGLAVQAAESFVVLGPEFDAADVADAEEGAVGLGAHDDVAELLRVDEAAAGVHGILEIGSAGRRRLADGSGGILAVLRLDGVVDVGGGDAELGHLVGVDPDAHAVVFAARRAGCRRRRGCCRSGSTRLICRVVIEKERIVTAVGRGDGDGGEEGGRDLLDGDTDALDFGRKNAGERG